MHRLRNIIVVFVTLLSCVGCDQATKAVVKEYLPRGEMMSFVGDTVRLQYTENRGAFLSMGASLPERARELIFTGGVGVIVFGLLCYLLIGPCLSTFTTISLALICGGGFSNLIDRIASGGYVIDFLNVGIGGLRTGIFNAADVAILVGAFLVALSGARCRTEKGFYKPSQKTDFGSRSRRT